VSASRILSECPAGVVIAKEKRWKWAAEEAADLAAWVGGRVEETPFRGVILVYGPDPKELASVLTNLRMAFISRITLVKGCVGLYEDPTPIVVRGITGLGNRVDVRFYLRGRSKGSPVRSVIERVLNERGVLVRRRSKDAFIVEGFDDFVVFGWGRKRSCGYDCVYVW